MDLRHEASKEALWIESGNVTTWMGDCRSRVTALTKEERGMSSGCAASLHLSQRDELSWTAQISHKAEGGQSRQALAIYFAMRQVGVKPSSYTFVAALKACRNLKNLQGTKQIHADVIETGFKSDANVGNMLVDVYAKCGSLVEARRVFESLPCRDVVSWNSMISGCANVGEYEEALQLYASMQQEGGVPNGRTFIGVLKACSIQAAKDMDRSETISLQNRCLDQVRTIHSEIITAGAESDVFIANVLMDTYTTCGSLVDARCVFDRMPHRNVVSWTTIISSYAQMQQSDMALQLYSQVQQEGILLNCRIFVAALKACRSMVTHKEDDLIAKSNVRLSCLQHVKAIHSAILQHGYETDVFVGNMLVDVYVKCGSLGSARTVFENMPLRNVITWSALILGYAQMKEGAEALQLYARMQQEGVAPNDRTFVGALRACSSLAASEESNEKDAAILKQRALQTVRAIHSHAVHSGCEFNTFVGTMLVDAYAKCGSMFNAKEVFDKMPHRNAVSWTAMILGYAQLDEGEEALQMYARMQQEQLVMPDAQVYVGALQACVSMDRNRGDDLFMKRKFLKQVRAIHADLDKDGFGPDVILSSMLVDLYAKSGSLSHARRVFERMPYRNVVSWTTMILGYVQVEKADIALQLYTRMQKEGVVPNHRTFVAVLKACANVATLEKGREIHAQLSETRLETSDSFVANSLIDMYCKCGSMVDAQQVFDRAPKKNVVTWSALIGGYARQGSSDAVFKLFQNMRQNGIQPDGVTCLSILNVCSHVGLVDKGLQYFEAMSRDYGVTPTIEHYSCIVDLLSRAGKVEEAMQVVKTMPYSPPTKVWRCLLGACQKWSKVELGRVAFECAVRLDECDGPAYVLMSNIYMAAQMPKHATEIQARWLKAKQWNQPTGTSSNVQTNAIDVETISEL